MVGIVIVWRLPQHLLYFSVFPGDIEAQNCLGNYVIHINKPLWLDTHIYSLNTFLTDYIGLGIRQSQCILVIVQVSWICIVIP